MPKRQIYKKLDATGNIEDLGFTVTQEEINNWNEINNISNNYAEKTHTHTEYLGKNSNAVSADKLLNAKTIGLSTAVTSTAKSFDGTANITIPVNSVKEAYLTWGGKHHTGSYAPIDAAMIPQLGANRLAFTPASCITLEYSTDGGSTWTNLDDDSLKSNLFTPGAVATFLIGNSSQTGIDKSKYMCRVTITTTGKIYSELNKFAIYVSTNGSSNCYCTLTARTKADQDASNDTWATFAENVPLLGWSGWNILNTSPITTHGNTSAQYSQLRFTFGVESHSSTSSYPGFKLQNIMAFGGVGWSTPSKMAANGNLFSWDSSQNASFPANVTATTFNGSLNGNAASATKATKDGNGNVIASTYLPVTGGSINGNLTITGNITQNGSTYITHAEEVRTTKDYIYLRDGATGSLANNSYSGFEFVKYDGTNNGRLVIDNKGIARVGDAGDEQPLATREESPINGGFAKWDSTTNKFITDSNVATADHTHTKADISDFDHSHSYLPLSGGNLSGTVNMTNGDFLARYVGIANAGHETSTYDKIAILSNTTNGYVRYRTKAELASDLNALLKSGGDISGHIYLTGAQVSSSTGNTSQLVFGTSDNNHLAITSNKGALVLNPSTTSTTGQMVLHTGTGTSKIPGSLTVGYTATASTVTADTFNVNASGTINLNGTTNATGAKLKWATVNTKNPYIGYATDQSDGTFVWSITGTDYRSGLAIGGGSGNLLWKGVKVATVADITSSGYTPKFIDISSDSFT